MAQQVSKKHLSSEINYEYEKLHSKPIITPDSEIPENVLHLSHSFGYDSGRRGNLQLLDDKTQMFVAGNMLVLLDVSSKEQRYIRSCSGGGIGSISTHPSKEYFAVAEKGNQPNIIIYEYPSLRLYRILRGGTERTYSFVDFNRDGSLLASVGSDPDYMLTLWDWRQEEVALSCKAISQEVYRVSFSPYNPELLTTSGSHHIKFWKMAITFTGLKLQGLIGHFGKTMATDIEGYVELPDGKVVSGSDWGNLLLWDGNAIKVEICRNGGQNCHNGIVQPFALEDGQLMTIGSDGVVRGWDFECIDTADSNGNSSRFEMEPMNELVVGHNVCLTSVVKSSTPDSFLWFAQDSSGAIWKLDLSFINTAADPECLFCFHAGPIQGLDLSRKSHLMATTALDRSVKVFDFLAKRELTTSRFNQGGTTLCWAPTLVSQGGGLLVTGFEDGVVRLLELFNPQRLDLASGRSPKGDAKLRLKQAFKPHNAPVTAVAYERNGEILATGSSDGTVFFFTVGEKYNPIGYFHVPGPVQALEWSPHSHSENRLLILCQSGHVVEVESPGPETQRLSKTFQLPLMPSRTFRFRSIKSRIKREEGISRRKDEKEKKRKEREEMLKDSMQPHAELEEEEQEEEELPAIYIPDPPSPLYCGFYSQPGQFWLSMGGFDAGFLYHCKFSENQDQDPDQRDDEPFDFLQIHNADGDPIRAVSFSSNRRLLLCGMQSGVIRVYPLQPDDQSVNSMQAYWALSVHDNQYGHLRHIHCSHDDLFVLTAGDDGNIFSFSLLPPEELQKSLQRKRANVPSPRKGLQNEALAQDIEDPAAYSIETAKQKMEKDCLRREAELRVAAKRKKLAELREKYQQVLKINQGLPEHVRLTPMELQLDPCFTEHAERLKAQRARAVRKQMAWEEERCDIALRKLQEMFKDSLESNVVTVFAIRSEHRVSSYHLPALSEMSTRLQSQISVSPGDAAEPGCKKSRTESAKEGSKVHAEDALRPLMVRQEGLQSETVVSPGDGAAVSGWKKSRAEPETDSNEEVLRPLVAHQEGKKVMDMQVKKPQKVDKARSKKEKRKPDLAQLHTEKPDENYKGLLEVQAIEETKASIGDLKLKSDKDFTVPKHLRMNAEKKRAELIGLEINVREKQAEMNKRIMALRDSKVCLVSQLKAQTEQLKEAQKRLAAHHHHPLPALPIILPEETPEKKLQYSPAVLERYRALREQRCNTMEQDGAMSILEQLEKEKEEKEDTGEERAPRLSTSSVTREEEKTTEEGGAELSELEKEIQREEEIRLLHMQDSLLGQMEHSVCEFDAELMLLRHEKLRLDCQLKMADLHQLTLYQELLILVEYEKTEDSLQEKLNTCMKERDSVTSELKEITEQLELKQGDIAMLQEKEKTLFASFKASLAKDKKFEEFLTEVFKKKIKRLKKKELIGDEGEEEEEEDGDDDDSSSDEEGDLDYSVCPPGCNPVLFESTLQLREHRLDLEELLMMEKKNAEALKRECDILVKKEIAMKSSCEAAEEDLELVYREKQQKMNELDVAVPLRLSQIEFLNNGLMSPDLSKALLMDRAELARLQEQIVQLPVKQRELASAAHKQQARLKNECKAMTVNIQDLKKDCEQKMIKKFGRLVDLEALQKLGRTSSTDLEKLEELKLEKCRQEAAHAKEIKEYNAKVKLARDALDAATRSNTEVVRRMTSLMNQKRDLEKKNMDRKNKMAKQQLRDSRRLVVQEDIRRLKDLVKAQSQEAETLRREIFFLSRQGGHILPPIQEPAPLYRPKQNRRK